MKRILRTNLELDDMHLNSMRNFKLEETPQIGSILALEPRGGPTLFLEVCRIMYSEDRINIELHLEKVLWDKRSLIDFHEWYELILGHTVEIGESHE